MLRNDFVSNSSSSSFVFVTNEEYNLPSIASDVHSCTVSDLIYRSIKYNDDTYHTYEILDNDKFTYNFFCNVCEGYNYNNVEKLKYLPKCIYDKLLIDKKIDPDDSLKCVFIDSEYDDYVIELLRNYFKNELYYSVVSYTIEDFIDGKFTEYECDGDIPNNTLYYDYIDNH